MLKVLLTAAVLVLSMTPARAEDYQRPEWRSETQASSRATGEATFPRNDGLRPRTQKAQPGYSARYGTSLYGKKGVYNPSGAYAHMPEQNTPIVQPDAYPYN